MGNLSIGGYKVGDRIGVGQVIHPSEKGQYGFDKRVTVDVNGNGKADPGDQVVLVAYKKPLDRTIIPAFNDVNADNPVARKLRRLEKASDVGGKVALSGLSGALVGLGLQSRTLIGVGAAAVVAGGALYFGAGGVCNAKEKHLVRQHLDQAIPSFIPAKP